MPVRKVTTARLLALLRGPEWLSRDAHIVILARSLRTLGYGCTSILVAGMLSEDGVSAVGIGVLLGVAALGSVTASVAMGIFADRFGRRRSLLVTAGLMGLAGMVVVLASMVILGLPIGWMFRPLTWPLRVLRGKRAARVA